ncbi:hypothetical protein L207DRAFT_188656 [Hyaloscypha variabilis F]|uniref:Uncharacterized protein n=1 Tax=Hyaloscypha variabilis (strain UAMH 11265 / GT02V1 / F) TaxID=1149755 RepID=A0A2J6QYU2_HYAVF|nr:hypothetical protein L207DRAFT_188656 [Hyaloscypha variabilis F]
MTSPISNHRKATPVLKPTDLPHTAIPPSPKNRTTPHPHKKDLAASSLTRALSSAPDLAPSQQLSRWELEDANPRRHWWACLEINEF